MGDQGCDEPGSVQRLCRNPACPNPEARGRGDFGQPVQPQELLRRGCAELHRRVVPVPAALQPRSQSNRNGILKTQNPDPKGGSQILRRLMASRRPRLRPLL